MPLYYDKFSEMQIDWPMLLVGWRGFAGKKLSAEQVVTYALEQVGEGTPEQDEIAALLANADALDWQAIDHYLEQIAGEHFDRELALRKWRLSGLKRLLPTLPRPGSEYPEDEWLSVFEDLADFWYEHDELPDSQLMRQNLSAVSIEEMLGAQRAWVEHEEIALCKETETEK